MRTTPAPSSVDPTAFDARINRGSVRYLQHEYSKAIDDYAEATRRRPEQAAPHNALAWALATCTLAKYRDGKRAVVAATAACELSKWKNADHLDTLAAAYAETGDFAKAIAYETKAIDATDENDDDAWEQRQERLKLFQEKKPYHEPSPVD